VNAQEPALQRLIDHVRTAAHARAPLAIRGGGTKDFYGQAPLGEPLDMTPFAGIPSYEPTELVVTARAGTPLDELEAALAQKGQCLPFEPPHFGARTTVGGMVAAGLSGPARAAAGAVRDYVLGATLLDGRGEVLSFGGQVMKNVAGYDVSRLLAGSLGTLGVILEVSLKVLPVAPATATVRFAADAAGAIRMLNEWGARPLPIHASAWSGDTLTVRLSGARAAVEAAGVALGGEVVEPAAAASFWRALRDQSGGFFAEARDALASGAALWRVAVPSTTPPLALAGTSLVEWGGAQRWLVSRAPAQEVRGAAARAGGHATLFRAEDKSAGVFTPLAGPLERIHRQLKASFDPQGIFNPGRLYPGL